jgi:hypothetical protein
VRRIIDLQKGADSLSNVFSDLAKVTKSYIPAANVPTRKEVSEKGFELKEAASATHKDRHGTAGTTPNSGGDVAQAAAPLRKCGRP